ncbi:non-ribosomal peptide synthase/polyketide synthase [Alkaliphilus transvaalensis]|uniref:non-ribosomal peptide synthase/polyketide synthase n=1 Tax=Alkaliphilus transvaalensis TaxID=114628 RepID=UPI000685A15E|nr:non-ribosomal peptide synthetase [Alkaliphilus transvaalensis]
MHILPIKIEFIENFTCIEQVIRGLGKWKCVDFQLMFLDDWEFDYSKSWEMLSEKLQYTQEKKYSLLEKYHNIKFNVKVLEDADKDEAFDYIKESVLQNRPVGIIMDYFWTPWHPSYYKKQSTLHYLLVIGVDEATDEIICIDPQLAINGERLDRSHFSKGAIESNDFYLVDENNQIHLKDILDEIYTNLFENKEKGNMFQEIRRFADSFLNDFDYEGQLELYRDDPSISPCLKEVFQIGNSRANYGMALKYISEKYNYNKFNSTIEGLNLSYTKWRAIFGILMKAFYTGKVKESKNKVFNRLLEIANLEEELYFQLKRILEDDQYNENENLPLYYNENRKMDLEEIEEEVVYEAPRNEVEEKLVEIWEEVLRVDRIGINDNFFELGGHSLNATVLVGKIYKALNVEVSIREVFTLGNIKALAQEVATKEINQYEEIPKVEEEEYYPVSSAQKRMYMVQQFELESTAYNVPWSMLIEGKLEIEKVENVLIKLIERHESLRTSFEVVEGEILQKIHKLEDINFTLEIEKAEDDKVAATLNRRFIRFFDLSKAPLLRAGIVKINDEKHILTIDMHHIITDGVSMGIFSREFSEFYQGIELKELKIQYKDFSAWQNNQHKKQQFQKQEEYWLKDFAGEIPILNLPTDYTRPKIQSFEGDNHQFIIGKEETKALRNIAIKTGSTMFMVLLSSINILLSKYSNQADFVVGTPIAGRQHKDLETLVGMFVNTLSIRTKVEEQSSFREYLKAVKEKAIMAYENQDYQFEELVEKLNLTVDLGRNPLFDVMFAMQNLDIAGVQLEGLRITEYGEEFPTAKFDLTITAVETEEEIIATINYSTNLYNKATIEKLKDHFINILKIIIKNVEIKIKDIDIVTEEERRELLETFNDTTYQYPKNKLIHNIFEEEVKKNPNGIAVVFNENKLTYNELNQKANQLARILVEKGVKTDVIVAIMVERSLEMIVGIMAILKAGGAYLPIAPEYPIDRINFMLEDSDTNILLSQEKLIKNVTFDGTVLSLDHNHLYQGDDSNLSSVGGPESLAYVIYTSGSTGNPKGVMVHHQGAVNYLTWAAKSYIKGQRVSMPLYTNISFDLTVTSIFTPVITGNTIVIYNNQQQETLIEDIIKDNQVEVVKLTPAHLRLMANIKHTNSKIKRLIVGGEQLETALAEKIYYAFGGNIEIYNEYGPTEATVGCMIHQYDPQKDNDVAVPIGKPADNVKIYILDQHKKPVPNMVIGEIYISGDGVAKGYLNNPKLSMEKFINNPYVDGERMYKTGDLARRLSDSNIEFVGRIDHQVKIRGYRIELGEIENALLQLEGIKAVAVIDLEEEGNKYLTAYLVSENNYSVKELRESLKRNLPDYMIPSYFITLEKLPLNQNGKVDRKALPLPSGKIDTGEEYEAPTNEIEEKLVQLWSSVLRVDQIGINDEFFSLGGDSIKAIQIVARAKSEGCYFEVKDLFKVKTIKELGKLVRFQTIEIDQGIVEGEVPLTAIQRWFFESTIENKNHYNQSTVLFSKEGFEVDHIKKTFLSLIKHHDVLRMIYKIEKGQVIQINKGLNEQLFSLEVYNFKEEKDNEEKITEICTRIQSSININEGPLVKLGLFKTKEGDHLLVAIHHLVIDGVSWRILLEDITDLYRASKEEKRVEEIKLPNKTTSFKEWANRLVKYANSYEMEIEANYWRSIEEKKVEKLPKDKAVSTVVTTDTGSDIKAETINLSEEETANLLRKVNRAYGTEINDILLTALTKTIGEWTGYDKVLINLESHGREEIIEGADITRTVGWFTAQYPVILERKQNDLISDLIKNVKDQLRLIPNKGIGYGILRYLSDEKIKQGIEFRLDPEISFNYLGEFKSDDNFGGFGSSKIDTGDFMDVNEKPLFALDFIGVITKNRLNMDIKYSKSEYHEVTIKTLAEKYKENLLEIVEHCQSKKEVEVTASDITKEKITLVELEPYKAQLHNIEKIFPLTPMESGMLFHSIADKGSEAYHETIILEVKGNIREEIFEACFNKIIERYDILRTIFDYESFHSSMQIVFKKRPTKIDFEDISKDLVDREAYLDKLVKEDRRKPFNLSKDLLIRMKLIKTDERQYSIIISNHHIIMDGWCLNIIISDLIKIYNQLNKGEELNLETPPQYSTYVEWLTKQNTKEANRYWREYLDGFREASKLPYEEKTTIKEYKNSSHLLELSKKDTKAIEDLAKRNNVTVNNVMQSIWGIQLQKYNNVGDSVFGYVVSGRNGEVAGIEEMVGLFINTLPLRIRSGDNPSYKEILEQVNNSYLENSNYEYYSLADIQGASEVKENLIDSIMVFQNYPINTTEINNKENSFEIIGLKGVEHTNYNFNIIIIHQDVITIKFAYNENKYLKENVEKISSHFESILKSITEIEEIKIKDIELVSAEEKHQIVEVFNDTAADYPRDKTIQQLFEEQVEKTPNNVALVFRTKELTYKALNEKSNQLARVLVEKGVKADTVVGIMVKPSLEMFIGIMGILKAGGAYLPIDHEYPENRISFMIQDSGTRFLLTQSDLGVSLSGVEILLLDEAGHYSEDGENFRSLSRLNDLAYVIYTSGSTGRPKGVMVQHSSLTNQIEWHQKYYEVTENDRSTKYAGFGFDASLWETFPYLNKGATIHIIGEDIRYDMNQLNQYFEDNNITISYLPTQICQQFMEVENRSLRILLTGGDKLKQYIKRGYRVFNNYGPTENTVVTTNFLVDRQYDNIPIGKPIGNNKVYILDQHNNLQPIGVVGELCIGGYGLARGYLNRPEQTAEKFVENPFTTGERIYRTGDLARWLPDGNIEFLGRIDHQVKIRGYRIELGEIENSLFQFEEIEDAVVIDLEEEGNKYLAAYIVTEREYSIAELREGLRKYLPDYMIPSYFITLEKFPLNRNGKIDRKALPKPSGEIETGVAYEAPRNEIEEKLVKIWQEVLKIDRIGINDNFFDLGGHSLKATVLIGKIKKVLNVAVTIRAIFSLGNIKALAEGIASKETNQFQEIERVKEDAYYPVSSAQKRMYMLQQFDPESIAYNMPWSMVIEGGLEIDRVEVAIGKLIKRHESLRTSFIVKEGIILQKIYKSTEIDFNLEVKTAKDEEEAVKIIDKFIRFFNLNEAPLIRGIVIKLEEEKHILTLDMHHIISDGVSMGIISEELSEFYQGVEKEELKIQYKDFAAWQNRLFKSPQFKKQEEYWLKEYEGEIPVLNLPTDYPRPQTQSFEGELMNFNIGKEEKEVLRSISKKTGCTMFMLLLSAFNILLSKYSNQEDVIVGTPIAGRQHKDLENVVGMFVNTLAIRSRVDRYQSYKDYLQEVKEKALKAYENQDYQFDELVDNLNIIRDLSRNPLFDVIFLMQNLDQTGIELDGLVVREHNAGTTTSKFDLSMLAVEAEKELVVNVNYCSKLYNKETIERLSQHYINVLKVIIENEEVKIKDIELVSVEEKRQIVEVFNDTTTDYPRDKTIQQLFEEQVEKTPDQIAVVYEDKRLTYHELNERSNQLARLLRSKGVKSDTIVSIMVDRSLEMMVGIMGILKAGGAYLPIDPQYPIARITFMLEDSNTELLLTQSSIMDHVSFKGEIINLEDGEILKEDTSNLEHITTAVDLAYVIYTSGSTGKPKGNLIMHYNVIRLLKNTNYIQITQEDTLLQLSNYAFDGSAFDIFNALLNGGKLVLVSKDTVTEISSLAKIIRDEKVSVFFVTTALFNVLVDVEIDCFQGIRKVLFGGERVSVEHARKALQFMGPGRILHVYGPTESTVYATYYEIDYIDDRAATIPIGGPISNTVIYITDQDMNLQPVGVQGEICIGGDGLARGYLNRPELSAEKFINNPFGEGKVYKTGDLARWLPDGNIEFIGRKDHQVKIRGFRIELGEIETLLLDHKAINEAIVIARENIDGSKYLYSYITSDEEVDTKEIKEYVSTKLPDYMIPTFIIQLARMPLTPNGKIDTRALPVPEGIMATGATYEAPTNEIEEKLVEIWQEVLKLERIGIKDNFFDLGGHSLKATVLMGKINKALNVAVTIREIFSLGNIKALAEGMAIKETSKFEEIKRVKEDEHYPVSSAQKRMYMLQQFDLKSIAYNMPWSMVIEGRLEIERLEMALRKLIERHESLRTSFMVKDGVILQKINKIEDIVFNLEVATAKEEDEAVKIINQFTRFFDLNEAPLIRGIIIKLEKEKHILTLDMHHIISDGVSMGIISKEFSEFYRGIEKEELKIQYKDFTAWQNSLFNSPQFKKQEEYWLKEYEGEIPVLNLPTDYPRPKIQSFEGEAINFSIGKEESAVLRKISRKTGCTMFMMLLSAFNILLSKYSNQEDIVVGTPIVGRQHKDLENVVGMFVNTLAIKSRVDENQSYKEYLQEVKEKALKAYENQDYQFEELVEKLNITRDVSRNPLFDVTLSMENLDFAGIEIEGLAIKGYGDEYTVAKFDLSIAAVEVGEELLININYSSKLYNRATIERLSQHYINILKAIVENEEVKIKDIELVSAEEKHQLLEVFNATSTVYPRDKAIHQLFEEQVKKTPNNIAVVFETKELTYKALNEKANQLARVLVAKGVKADTLVGIMVEPSLEMIVGMMAILKAGGAYLPIDPEYPQARIMYMLKDSGAHLILSQSWFKSQLDVSEFKGELIALDKEWFAGENNNLDVSCNYNSLAYIIYTSGSTGKPKAVAINHQSVVNLCYWFNCKYDISSNRNIIQTTNLSFDVAVEQIFGGLLNGGTVYIPTREEVLDKGKLNDYLRRHKIQIAQFVPATLTTLLEGEGIESLEVVTVGGDQLSNVLKDKVISKGYNLYNHYGPTEATVDTLVSECRVGVPVTIGKPINNTRVYVLQNNKLQPIGIPGELYIAGDGLARGYLNTPELTEERFIEHLFIPGERMYRTGDLVRWLPDGNIEFLGRVDQQVKIRGFRIELGEIENSLLRLDGIKDAVIIDLVEADHKYLIAYIMTEREYSLTELREGLRKNLPDYMIPSYFITLDQIPLNHNGKVDRKALPKPSGVIETGAVYESPRNELEEKLVSLWKEVLGVDKVGINDNFFELGGHSIKLIKLVSLINKELGINVEIVTALQKPTIKEFTESISTMTGENQIDHSFIVFNPNQVPKIFAFPPLFGSALIFNRLAEMTPNYSIVAFNFIEGESQIEEYIKLITNIQKDGQYTLMGYSAGGNLMVEVAKEMEVRGYEVNKVIILDSVTKSYYDQEIKVKYQIDIDSEVEEMKKHSNLKVALLDAASIGRMKAFLSYHHNAKDINGKLSADIYTIMAEKDEALDPSLDLRKGILGWREYTKGEFTLYEGSGDHSSLLEGDHLKKNGQIIKGILEK